VCSLAAGAWGGWRSLNAALKVPDSPPTDPPPSVAWLSGRLGFVSSQIKTRRFVKIDFPLIWQPGTKRSLQVVLLICSYLPGDSFGGG
ncbi:Protein Jade-3, partial [Dissostichus eleginoides]